ncbi:Gfo/Idh/MocA family oxidoreductase [Lentzea sp. NBRC 105346]|uniref:Gfo/Idh/MocA family protein n=1 Tax=Lentzea sp. NBRC 105346 TaxID=3032205 RepID=UPI0025548A29|nr:Gfo/Idh/MocA family oxidoreductase [Lentzea sp. NBRC 105346]
MTNSRFDVRAVVAQHLEQARRTAEEFAIPAAHSDVTEMLSSVNPDAVVVATPPSATPSILRTVIDHGCLVLVDKPAGSRSRELREIVADSPDASVVVSYNRRYQVPVRACRALLSDVDTADVHRIRCTWRGPFAARYNSSATHRHAVRFGDGVLLDTASHVLDTLNYLGVVPTTVVGVRARQGGAAGADIEVDMQLTTHQGARVQISIRNDDAVDGDLWCVEFSGGHGQLDMTRDVLVGTWHGQAVSVGAADVRRPVDDLLALADGTDVCGATLAEAVRVLELLDSARQHVENAHELRRWQRPRAKALGRLNGAC